MSGGQFSIEQIDDVGLIAECVQQIQLVDERRNCCVFVEAHDFERVAEEILANDLIHFGGATATQKTKSKIASSRDADDIPRRPQLPEGVKDLELLLLHVPLTLLPLFDG